MQALNETFANPAVTAFSLPEQAKGGTTAAQWTCGQVPPLGPSAEGGDFFFLECGRCRANGSVLT